jgi:hypothetical protein
MALNSPAVQLKTLLQLTYSDPTTLLLTQQTAELIT